MKMTFEYLELSLSLLFEILEQFYISDLDCNYPDVTLS